MDSKITWLSDMYFQTENRGIVSYLDSSPDFGGNNKAPTPKEVVLNAMSTCSAIDIVALAKKMRLDLKSLSVQATAEKTKTIPSYFASVDMKFFLDGSGGDEKLINCVVMSMTKYCGVSFMISKVCPINYQVFINNQCVHKDQARFSLETLV